MGIVAIALGALLGNLIPIDDWDRGFKISVGGGIAFIIYMLITSALDNKGANPSIPSDEYTDRIYTMEEFYRALIPIFNGFTAINLVFIEKEKDKEGDFGPRHRMYRRITKEYVPELECYIESGIPFLKKLSAMLQNDQVPTFIFVQIGKASSNGDMHLALHGYKNKNNACRIFVACPHTYDVGIDVCIKWLTNEGCADQIVVSEDFMNQLEAPAFIGAIQRILD